MCGLDRYLVVGSDGFVGNGLMSYLQQTQKQVIGTTRRPQRVDTKHLHLDLSEDIGGWQCPDDVTVAIVCAGVTKLEACRHAPSTSARVNVYGISSLVSNLVKSGVFVIYLSTNQVFNGSVPHRLPDDPVSPITEYGRQKAEAERRICQWGDSVSILRLSKVLEEGSLLFREWVLKLRQQKPIHPFGDMTMAPVSVSTVVTVIQLIAENRTSGVMQVSGNRDISYAEAAVIGAKFLGFDEGLIQPINTAEAGHFQEQFPKYTTMDVQRLRDVFGIEPVGVNCTIRNNFANIVTSLNKSS